MDCNKDDALRHKELAEKVLLKKDFATAKVFAKKAQELCPNLDGLSQLLATIDVYISAEKRVNEELDWYGILGVQPLANEETIRRRYRKLALTLHPDKNKSIGADGAFNLISQAWCLLSDQAKRIAYDKKCNLWGMPASQNGLSNSVFTPVLLRPTFWTICRFCSATFEFHNVHLNSKVKCIRCDKLFLASEISPPPGYRNVPSTSRFPQMRQYNFNTIQMERNYHVSGMTPMPAVNSSLGSGPFSMPHGISRVPTSVSSAAGVPGVFRMSSEDLKRMQEDSAAVLREVAHFGKIHAAERTGAGSAFQPFCVGSNSILKEPVNSILKEHRPRKKRPTDEHKVGCDRSDMETKTATQNGGINLTKEFGSQKNSLDTGRGNAAGNYKRGGASQLQIKNMLMDKARKEIHKKLDEWKASDASKKLDKSKNTTETEIREKGKKRVVNSIKSGAQEFVDSETLGKKCFPADPEPELPSLAMNVPDPDFHDFDGDRTENAFGENQVWAVYDNDDGMPRYFCLINDVISKNPFKMRISWLNAKGNDELAPIKWVGFGFLKTSGDFRIGKRVSYSTLNSFSHRVEWTKGSRGVINICPKKGDIWALYRNWSLEWNQFTEDEIIHKYDMVEVLEDYSEEQGVNVSPLVKVAGFKTVFRQNADPTKVKNISKAEMFRFSHQVPSYLLTGEEGHNAPNGCIELDPAATPMELLQVLTEDLEQELVMTAKKSVEDEVKQKENSKEDGSVEKGQTTTKEEGSEGGLGEKSVEDEVKQKENSKEDGSVEKGQTTTKEEGSEGGLGEKRRKPEIVFVYKRRRLGQKKDKKSGMLKVND